MQTKLSQKKSSKAALKNRLEKKRLLQLIQIEAAVRSRGFQQVVGVDEAGRGPLAGPVVAAACLIAEDLFFPGINDSKVLAPQKREELFEQLRIKTTYGIGIISHEVIDSINILQATHQAMREAVAQLPFTPDYILVDGRPVDFGGIPSEGVIKGDSRSQAIAAASILAKVTRDRIMLYYHEQYPEYGFDEHKGYGTEKHLQMLAKYGPSPIHRRSFKWGL